MVVLSARGLNEKIAIVSKATREDYLLRFRRAGANAAISPQEWASRRMIQSVLRPNLLQLLSRLLDPAVVEASLDEIEVPKGSHVVGKKLAESGLRESTGIVILGIMRTNGEMEHAPGPSTVIREGDILIGFGKHENFRILEKALANGK